MNFISQFDSFSCMIFINRDFVIVVNNDSPQWNCPTYEKLQAYQNVYKILEIWAPCLNQMADTILTGALNKLQSSFSSENGSSTSPPEIKNSHCNAEETQGIRMKQDVPDKLKVVGREQRSL